MLVSEKGISAKFLQNPNLMKTLKDTGTKTLVECAYDCLWGCGIPLHADNCLNETEWNGDNLLGKILMKVRSLDIATIGDNTATTMET